MKENYKEKDYIIKDHCAVCGKKIKNNWQRFQKYGNYCFNCDLKCLLISKIRGKISFINKFKRNKKYTSDVKAIKKEIKILKKQLAKKFDVYFDIEIRKMPIEFIESILLESISKGK